MTFRIFNVYRLNNHTNTFNGNHHRIINIWYNFGIWIVAVISAFGTLSFDLWHYGLPNLCQKTHSLTPLLFSLSHSLPSVAFKKCSFIKYWSEQINWAWCMSKCLKESHTQSNIIIYWINDSSGIILMIARTIASVLQSDKEGKKIN